MGLTGVLLGGNGSWAGATSSPAEAALQLSSRPVPISADWARYDEAPRSVEVRPVRVIQVNGDVAGSSALINENSGETTLTYHAGGVIPSLVLDYGQDVGGVPTFDVGMASVHSFEVSYSETLANLGHDGAATAGFYQSGDAQRTVEVPVGPSGVRMRQQIQGGERYERISLTEPGVLTLRAAGVDFTAVRGTTSVLRGRFVSSDDLLNRIWYAGAYTLNLDEVPPGTRFGADAVNEQHLILDGAKRDRAVWSGDLIMADLTDFYTGDPAFSRDSLALLLGHPATIAAPYVPATGSLSQAGPLPGTCSPNPDVQPRCFTWSATYSMDVVIALADYYHFTGDVNFVRQNWSTVTRQMAWDASQVGSDGLFVVNSADDADWSVEKHSGEVTFANVDYADALRSAASLATALGKTTEATTWQTAGNKLATAINDQLWNSSDDVYSPSTSERSGVVQDANVMAVLSGVAGRGRAASILSVLARSLKSPYGPLSVASPAPFGFTPEISPYMGGFNVEADFEVGRPVQALALITREWGYMVTHDPGGVDWESIGLKGVPAGGPIATSSAHAWSTGPTALLSEYVLGVEPVAPGYARWSVSPQTTKLEWAQGVVPSPHGAIGVRWRHMARSFVLTESTPHGTSGTVVIPLFGADRIIARDGRIVWTDGRPAAGIVAKKVGGSVQFAQAPGTATFAWSG
jgi:hypothetical protein